MTDQISTDQTPWVESLPEPFREAPFIKASKSAEEALQNIQNAASYMGNSIKFPGEDASPEAKQEFYQKVLGKAPDLMYKPTEDKMDDFYKSLGRPENATDYKFDIPEGREVPSDFESFSKIAHENGLTDKQFKGILGKVLEEQWAEADSNAAAQAEEIVKLKGEWGTAYDQNMSRVKNFLRLTDAPEGIVDLFAENAMSPTEIRWIHSLAEQMKSAPELAELQTAQILTITPAEAREKIEEIMGNREHAYWNPNDPRHEDAKRKVVELHRLLG
jgi:hypothetical protein